MAFGELVFDEAWDRASRIHLGEIPDLHASLKGLPAHLHDLKVRNDILANFALLGLLDVLVALARVSQDFEAICCLTFVEACDERSVRDKHRHLDLDHADFVAIIIWERNLGELWVD